MRRYMMPLVNDGHWQPQTVEELWGPFDPGEDGSVHGVTPVRDDLIRGARLTDGARVLDVGAGAGLIALEARRRVGATGRVVALDLSRAALSVCRERGRRTPAAALGHMWLAQG